LFFPLSSRTQTVEQAQAEAERVRLTGAAEARAIEAVGRAEAEKMRMKASAYKQYGDAAVMALVLEALPQIAAEVAAPLAKTDEIVLLGGSDRTTAEVSKLLGQLPPAVQALTGVDLSGVRYKKSTNFSFIDFCPFFRRPSAKSPARQSKHEGLLLLDTPLRVGQLLFENEI